MSDRIYDNFSPMNPEQCEELLRNQGVKVYQKHIPISPQMAALRQGKGQELLKSWYVSWRHGTISLAGGNEQRGRATAALFVSLWLKGVDAGLARDLACCYFNQDGK